MLAVPRIPQRSGDGFIWLVRASIRGWRGKGKPADLAKRVAQLKNQISKTTSDFDKEKFQERLAKLSGGVVQINVGAATEVEMKEKLERVKDAVEATKAAVEAGIVPGGAIALLDISQRMEIDEIVGKEGVEDETIGVEILKSSLEQPFMTLMSNSGFDPGQLIAKAREVSGQGMGFDVSKLESLAKAIPVDMVKAGIVDPAKVVKSALQNAASVAMMVLTTECLITDKLEKHPPAGGPGMPQGGMGGMGEEY